MVVFRTGALLCLISMWYVGMVALCAFVQLQTINAVLLFGILRQYTTPNAATYSIEVSVTAFWNNLGYPMHGGGNMEGIDLPYT